MSAERKINVKGGMQLKLFKTSFMLSESPAVSFMRSEISGIQEDVWEALSQMFAAAYEKGRMDQKAEIKKKHEQFLNSIR